MEIQELTERRVRELQQALGLGAILYSWDEVDYTRGLGVYEDSSGKRGRMWLQDGTFIEVALSRTGVVSVMQSHEPDPDLPEPYSWREDDDDDEN